MRMSKIVFGVLVFFIAFSGCKKGVDTTQDFFPAKQVYTNIDLRFPQYSNLNLLQGYVYLPDGYRGIILYHTTDDQFVAFDRTCPYNTDQACSFVTVDSNNVTIFRCGHYDHGFQACCNSTFWASSGVGQSGPAKRPLKQYYTSKSGYTVYVSSSPF